MEATLVTTLVLAVSILSSSSSGRAQGRAAALPKDTSGQSSSTQIWRIAAGKMALSDAPSDQNEQNSIALRDTAMVIDGHIDLPWKFYSGDTRTALDFERAKKGGLGAAFMSIYVPTDYQPEGNKTGGGRALADKLIDLVENMVSAEPEKYAIATSPHELTKIVSSGRVALPIGIENGAALGGELSNLKHFYDRGGRYLTLTHTKDNALGDSSSDRRHTWGGLSPFGKDVIREMNRLGMMIDLSHAADSTAAQALHLSHAPPIASHSSCRHFTPGFERNLSDALIMEIARRGGLVMVNFGSTFVTQRARQHVWARRAARKKHLAAATTSGTKKKGLIALPLNKWRAQYDAARPPWRATVSEVADHVDRVVALVGVKHVGIGSDFDGVGDSLPPQLADVSMYPNLFAELQRRDYSNADLRLIAGENLLRVWSAVEAFAKKREMTK